jgi:hypothetical protein
MIKSTIMALHHANQTAIILSSAISAPLYSANASTQPSWRPHSLT